MADPAAAGARNAGDPADEERPDLKAIEAMLAAITGTEWRYDPGDSSVRANTGLAVMWMAPDMEGHPDQAANGRLAAAAPLLVRRLVAEVRRLRAAAGITE